MKAEAHGARKAGLGKLEVTNGIETHHEQLANMIGVECN